MWGSSSRCTAIELSYAVVAILCHFVLIKVRKTPSSKPVLQEAGLCNLKSFGKVIALPGYKKQRSGRLQGMQLSLEHNVVPLKPCPLVALPKALSCLCNSLLHSAGLPVTLHTAMEGRSLSSSSAATGTGIWAEGLLQNKVAIVTGTQPSHADPALLSCTCHATVILATQTGVQAPAPL